MMMKKKYDNIKMYILNNHFDVNSMTNKFFFQLSLYILKYIFHDGKINLSIQEMQLPIAKIKRMSSFHFR